MRREIVEVYGDFFAKITKNSFFNLYEDIDHDLFYISTDKKWSFIKIPEFSSLDEFAKVLNEYSYYNCTVETGNSISFWVNISDLPLSKFNHFKFDYYRGVNLNYTTLVKQYIISTEGGEK